jgi:N-terminal domain of argonaute
LTLQQPQLFRILPFYIFVAGFENRDLLYSRDAVSLFGNLAVGQPNAVLPTFQSPLRPNFGTEGRMIVLRVNHFQVQIPKGFIHHYDVSIHPEKCPRRVNRSLYSTHE